MLGYIVGMYGLTYILPVSFIANLLFTWKRHSATLVNWVPRVVMIIVPVQNLAAVVTAACVLSVWILTRLF